MVSGFVRWLDPFGRCLWLSPTISNIFPLIGQVSSPGGPGFETDGGKHRVCLRISGLYIEFDLELRRMIQIASSYS